ncbi:MAG: hypothetical protein WA517_18060 [Candidatus Acidiferrum sp.]
MVVIVARQKHAEAEQRVKTLEPVRSPSQVATAKLVTNPSTASETPEPSLTPAGSEIAVESAF